MSESDGDGRMWKRVSAVLAILLLLALAFVLWRGSPTSQTAPQTVPPPAVLAAPTPDAASGETAMWAKAAAAGDPDAIQAYLDKYPNGIFAEDAEARLAQHGKKPSSGVSAAPAKQVDYNWRIQETKPEPPAPQPQKPVPLADDVCGPLPPPPVIAMPAALAGQTAEQAHEIVLTNLHDIKKYQAALGEFRECLITQVNADKKVSEDLRSRGAATEAVEQRREARQALYDKTIDDETAVITAYMDVHKAYCAMGDGLTGCAKPK